MGGNLDVGQVVQFTCEGADVRGRDLIWQVRPGTNYHSIDSGEPWAEVRGNPAVLECRVTEEHVGPFRQVFVTVTTPSRYKRHDLPGGGYDDARAIAYFVHPPAGA